MATNNVKQFIRHFFIYYSRDNLGIRTRKAKKDPAKQGNIAQAGTGFSMFS